MSINSTASSTLDPQNIRLFPGEVILDVLEKKRFRILYLPESDTSPGFWICIDEDKCNIPSSFIPEQLKLSLSVGKCEAVLDTTVISLRGENELSEAEKATMNRQYLLIKEAVAKEPAIYYRKERSEILHGIEISSGVNSKNLYSILGRYWRGGKNKTALAPQFNNRGKGRGPNFVPQKKLGRPGLKGNNGKILSEKDFKNFQIAINTWYASDKKPNLKDTYDRMITHLYTVPHFPGDTDPAQLPPDQKPSYMQFYYWHRKNKEIVDETKAREGDNRFELKHRGIPGKTETFISGPGTTVQIDATIADYYLVRSENRQEIIGRPVIYFIRDAKYRMITGLYITLEDMSWESALMAIKNMTENKVEFCKLYGIDITEDMWPCHHLPTCIIADNGEMGGHAVEDIITSLGIIIENTPPYRGDLKAVIEQIFNLLNIKLRWILPGHVDKDAGERGSIDRKKEAAIDFRTFVAIIIRVCLYYNNYWYMEEYIKTPEMRKYGIKPIPRDLWNFGIQFESGALKEMSQADIYRVLLPKSTASVTRDGIYFEGLYYTCEKASEENWFAKARIEGSWKIPISYDPTCVNHIYIHHNDKTLISCTLLAKNSHYAAMTEDDLEALKREDSQEKADYAQTLEKAKNNLILELEKVINRCKNEKDDSAKDKIGNVLKRNHVTAAREAEIDVLTGREAALKEQEEFFNNKLNDAEQCDDPEPCTSADDALDKAINAELYRRGLI